MSPFEVMYGKKCHTLLSWSQPEDRLILGLDALQEIEQIIRKIQQNIKTTQDIQKSYSNKNITHREFKIGDHVYLRMKPRKSTLRTGTCTKLAR